MIVASQLVNLVHITVPGLREQQLGPDSQTFFKFGFVSSQLLFCRPSRWWDHAQSSFQRTKPKGVATGGIKKLGLLLLSIHHSSENENFWVKECSHCKAFVARLPSREVAAYLYTHLEHMRFQILLIAGSNHCFNFLPESNSVGLKNSCSM